MGFETGLLIAVVIAVALGVPFMLRRRSEQAGLEARLLQQRKARRTASGRATIKSIERTGLSINDQPQVRIELELDLPDRVCTWTMKRIVDVLDIPRIQPGSQLAVRYDPDEIENMACELDADF